MLWINWKASLPWAFPGKVEGSRRDVRRGGEKGLVTCMKRRGVGEEKFPKLSMRVDGYCLVIVGEGLITLHFLTRGLHGYGERKVNSNSFCYHIPQQLFKFFLIQLHKLKTERNA